MTEINYLEELRVRRRVLRVNSTFYWFDKVDSGEKREEYRGHHWMSRILIPEACTDFEFAILSNQPRIPAHYVKPVIIEIVRGYTPMVQHYVIDSVRWGLPRREWSGDTIPNECFGIKLGERLCLK